MQIVLQQRLVLKWFIFDIFVTLKNGIFKLLINVSTKQFMPVTLHYDNDNKYDMYGKNSDDDKL